MSALTMLPINQITKRYTLTAAPTRGTWRKRRSGDGTATTITYQLQFRKCGKSSCNRCKVSKGHGPYWYAYFHWRGKLKSKYVGKIKKPIVLPGESAEALPSSS